MDSDFGSGERPFIPEEVEPECNLPITTAELDERMY